MLKAGLVTRMAKSANITKAQAKILLDCILQQTANTLQQGKKVSFTNFGTFHIHQQNQRLGVNPKTGHHIIINAKKVVKFKPAPSLKII